LDSEGLTLYKNDFIIGDGVGLDIWVLRPQSIFSFSKVAFTIEVPEKNPANIFRFLEVAYESY